MPFPQPQRPRGGNFRGKVRDGSSRYESHARTILGLAPVSPGQSCEALAEAVARSDFAPLAYEDGYEVARLYRDGAFLEELNAQLEGALRIEFSLAPPLPARRKGLRVTLLDPFGYTRDRRAERRPIVEYEHTLRVLRASLGPGNCALAAQIAALPQQTRDFGDVERDSCERVTRQEKALLDHLLERERTGTDEADGGDFGGADEIEHL